MKDEVRSGRPVTDKISAVFEKVEQDWHISSYDIAEELDVDHKTVIRHLRRYGTRKLDIWISRDTLLKRNNSETFLKQLNTGNEKLVIYNKNVRKR